MSNHRPKLIVKNKILLRVFVIFGSLLALNTLWLTWMIMPLQKQALQKIMYTQAVTVSRSIIQTSADAMLSEDMSFIVEHNVEVIRNNPGIRYVLVQQKRGHIIDINQQGWQLLEKLPEQFSHFVGDRESFNLLMDDQNNEIYHFVYPILFSNIQWGWLHVGFSTEDYRRNTAEMYSQVGIISAISLLVILSAGFIFARWITQPISAISALALKVAEGNLQVQAHISRNDEIGQLSESFNAMVVALQESKQQLQNYNQQLEDDVAERTKALDELNQSLDQRVKNEVIVRRQQEQLLIHQSRLAAMGEMIGAIAHQWRQPLNALGLVLQNIHYMYKQDKLDNDFMDRSLEKSDRLINNMSATIDDFRNFFKPNKIAEQFNLLESLQTVVDLLDASLKHNNINLVIDCDSNLKTVGYKSELSQVLLNLINNAKDVLVERNIKKPKILVSVSIVNQSILIDVVDNGGGVDASISDHIYDPYFTTKAEGKGTGIGLYMSKIIIETNMHGKLSCKNTDTGACFTINLPQNTEIAAQMSNPV
ncbi:HAMP domain-containing sensor histidine kinase [Methylomonas sp. AM2-LC]|uniref:sensor histidine kinase n=1 Tax=Methylomonas sp. AM2-LC TaxID=3153301 RepID=UPI0032644164